MQGSAQPDELSRRIDSPDGNGDGAPTDVDKPNGRQTLEEPELEAALQLLVERAQYITGATGTALALPQGEEMVCRASAGSCAPSIGARLQVRSGLTGESISRRQLLRCDNAEADPRVNLETCRALGIASIVVLPLLRRSGEVRGLFELFSDHPYAFEERDLIALERMADLTLTALDLAEQRHGSVPSPPPPPPKVKEAIFQPPASIAPTPQQSVPEAPTIVGSAPGFAEIPISVDPAVEKPALEPPPAGVLETPPVATPVPESMRRVQKCASCGFPVSEGRTLCLDCERKDTEKKQGVKKQLETKLDSPQSEGLAVPSDTVAPDEVLPPFLVNALPAEQSWWSNPVNILAILVLVVGIILAIVVFR